MDVRQIVHDFIVLLLAVIIVLAIQDAFAYSREARREAEKKLEACYSSCYSRCVK